MSSRWLGLRRWVLRPLAWSLAVLALAVLLAVLLLRSRWLREEMVARLTPRIEAWLERPVTIAELGLGLLPPELTLRGVVVGGRDAASPPLFRADRILLEADLPELVARRLRLREVRVEGPRLDLTLPLAGDTAARARDATPAVPRARRFDLRVGHLAVVDGSVRVEHLEIPLDLQADRVEAQLWGSPSALLAGQLGSERVEVAVGELGPWTAALSTRIEVDGAGVRIASATAHGAQFEAEARGLISWHETPTVELDLKGRVDASLLSDGAPEALAPSGTVRVDGRYLWHPGRWSWSGHATAAAIHVGERVAEGLAADIDADPSGLRVALRQGSYAGGSLDGDLVMEPVAAGRAAQLRLAASGADLLTLLEKEGIDLQALSGRLDATLSYALPGGGLPGAGTVEVRLRSGRAGLGQIPVAGAGSLVVMGSDVRTSALHLDVGAQQMTVNGRLDLGRGEGRLDVELDSRDVCEIFALFPELTATERPPWVPTAGSGRIVGVVGVSAHEPWLEASFELQDVDSAGGRADRLQGTLRLDRRGVHDLDLALRRSEAELQVQGQVPFAAAGSEAALAITLQAQGWPTSEVGEWLPFELPVEGAFFGELGLEGRPDDLGGDLRGELRAARRGDLELGTLAAELEFTPEEASLTHLTLRTEAGDVRLAGVVDRAAERVDLSLDSGPLRLDRAPFVDLVPAGLTGVLTLSGELRGPQSSPQGTLDLAFADLELAQRPVVGPEATRISLELTEGRLTVDAALAGVVRISGAGSFAAEEIDLPLDLVIPDLGALVTIVGGAEAPELDGALQGTLSIRRRDGEPSLSVAAFIPSLRLVYGAYELTNLEPVAIRWVGDALEIDSFYVQGMDDGSELFVGGRVGLAAEHPLDLHLLGSIPTSWLAPAAPGLSTQGVFEVLATVQGSLDSPRFNGQGTLRDGRVLWEGFPETIRDIGGYVLLYPGRVVIDSLRGSVAGGELRVAGEVTLPRSPESGIEYRLRVAGRELRAFYPEGWRLEGDADLVFESTAGGRQLRGNVLLGLAEYYEDVRTSLGLSFARQPIVVEETDPLLASTQLNVVIEGPAALRVRNNLAQLSGDLDLVLRGTLAAPVLFGEVLVDPGGALRYGGNDFEVERGELNFANPYRLEPEVDLLATTRVREYTVRLALSGPLENLNATFSSDPPLANLEILSLITTGDAGRLASAEVGRESLSASQLLYGQAASLVSSRVNTLFGLDRFRIDPLTSETGSLSAARVSIGKRLTPELFVTYSYDPSSTAEQVLQVEWEVWEGVTLLLTQNGDGSYAADLRQVKRF